MEDDFWTRCALGAKLHKFLGTINSDTLKEEDLAGEEWQWQQGRSNFKLFRRLMTDDHRTEEFQRSLGFQQRLSWILLQDWLGATYQHIHLSEAARSALEFNDYSQKKSFDVHPKFPATALTENSSYHFWLSELYCTEFMPSSLLWKPENIPDAIALVDNERRRASSFAACQKLAHTFYLSQEPYIPTRVRYEHRPSQLKETCHWLRSELTAHERPYYLWNLTQKRTIVVHELTEVPEYTCISHTWGRWRTSEMLTVEGVPEWRVPENTIFEVAKLPELLSQNRQRFTTEYIWFDLFCIPQENEDPRLAKLGADEIARQALIFRNAAACIAWLNYVENWKAEYSTIKWLSLAYIRLSTTPQTYQAEELLASAEKAADIPLQLLKHPFQNKHLHKDLEPDQFPLPNLAHDLLRLDFSRSRRRPAYWIKPSVWFSSLWTLQESYLRPDMMLMDRSFEALSDAAGNIITLEMIAALVETVQGLFRDHEIGNNTPVPKLQHASPGPKFDLLPMGVSQLFNMLFDVQILSRTHSSRAHILVQGNTRECTGRRAEAIMAVLGVTEWFSPNAIDNEQDLVLGMYPLSFVREAMAKIGPDFFLAQKIIGNQFSYIFGSTRGSMLPFEALDRQRRRGKKDIKMYPYQAYSSQFHPAVSTWTIEKSGVVTIKEAGILGSSDGIFRVSAPTLVLLTYQSARGKIINEDRVNIQRWLESQSKLYCTYAVNISRDLGLILQGFRFGPSQPQRLIKIGCYEVWDVEYDSASLPAMDWVPNRTVDWAIR